MSRRQMVDCIYATATSCHIGQPTCENCNAAVKGKYVEINTMVRDEETILERYAKNATTLAKAMATGKYVSDEERDARVAVCRTCEYYNGSNCKICGCHTGIKIRIAKILDLAAYEENLPSWGCKHPQRKDGKGWKLSLPILTIS